MMKPIYFPYTFVPEEIAQAGAVCFEQMVVCQPSELEMSEQMRASAKKGFLDIRVPETGDEDRIRTVVRDYRKWAEAHTDGERIHLALPGRQNNEIPFFNESSIMKIKEDIQRKIGNKEPVKEGPDPFFLARIFLCMAHELDMQHYDIHRGFQRVDKMEQALMKDLQGEAAYFSGDDAAGGMTPANDPFAFMVQERMEAWSGLMLHLIAPGDMPGLYVTSNRPVFAYVTEHFPEGEMVYELENIPIGNTRREDLRDWRNSFTKHIQQFAKDPWPSAKKDRVHPPEKGRDSKKTSLRLYIIPEKTPLDFFSGFYPHASEGLKKKNEGAKIANTLIGLFEYK